MRVLLIGSLLCSLAMGGLGTLSVAAEEKQPPPAAAKPPQEVATVRLVRQRIAVERTLPGRVRAFRQSVVRPQVDGIVTRRLFEEGAEVKPGQQLYQIDDTRYRAVVKSALADLRSAQANLKAVKARAKRYQEMVKANAISRQEYDDVVASLDQAQAAIGVAQAKVDLAQVDVDFSKVYAPIAGRISRSSVSEGALVTANQAQALATITALNPIYVDMQQSASDQAVIDLHTQLRHQAEIPVHVLLEHGSGSTVYAHAGKLKFSEVTMDESTGSITLRAELPNPDGHLLPGLFVRARLALGHKEVLLVPQRAATRTPQGEVKVWLVDAEQQAQQRTIQVEAAHQDSWVVSQGVAVGDELIVEGYQRVKAGQVVKTVPWESASSQQGN